MESEPDVNELSLAEFLCLLCELLLDGFTASKPQELPDWYD